MRSKHGTEGPVIDMRCIDADALHKRIKAKNASNAMMRAMKAECLAEIDDAPTIEPERKKKKHGKWIERESGTEDKENGFETVIVCSCCDFPATTFYSEDCERRTQIRTDFCPNCGADMRKEGENERPDSGLYHDDTVHIYSKPCSCNAYGAMGAHCIVLVR